MNPFCIELRDCVESKSVRQKERNMLLMAQQATESEKCVMDYERLIGFVGGIQVLLPLGRADRHPAVVEIEDVVWSTQ